MTEPTKRLTAAEAQARVDECREMAKQASNPEHRVMLKGGVIRHLGDFDGQCHYAWDKIKRLLAKHGATAAPAAYGHNPLPVSGRLSRPSRGVGGVTLSPGFFASRHIGE